MSPSAPHGRDGVAATPTTPPAEAPAVVLGHLARCAYATVSTGQLADEAGQLLAAAATYTAQVGNCLSWSGAVGVDRAYVTGVDHLGAIVWGALSDQYTGGWQPAEVRAVQAARQLVATARAALTHDHPANFTHGLAATEALIDRVDDALAGRL